MSASPLWLRAVLSIAVIFNGSLATAGSMPGMSQAGEAASATAAEAASGHCHDDNVAAVDTAAIEASAAHDHDGTPDCCKAGSCRCACVHATAMAEFVALAGVDIVNTQPSLFATRDDIVQRIARLDRPPIA